MLSEDLRGLDPRLIEKLRQMLSRLEDGPLPQALDLPGWKLHRLKGRDGRRLVGMGHRKPSPDL